jgi:O-antigen/teichoic acid export membrane protein
MRDFLKNVAVLASGTALAQVLTVLAYPLLMRMFTPAEFGTFSLFGAINLTCAAVASGRYEMAIVLARTEEEAANVLALTMSIILTVSAASCGVVWAFGDVLTSLPGYGELSGLLWFLPLMILTSTTAQVLAVWATRRKAYRRLSLSTISRSFGVAAAQLVAGLLGLGAGGLVLGLISGTVLSAAIIAWQVLRCDLPPLRHSVNWRTMKTVASRHRDFPLYSMPEALLSTTTVTVPSVMLTALSGPYAAGLYWFTYRLFEMPMTLLGDATRRVFYQQSAAMHRRGDDITGLFVRTTGGLAVMVTLPVVVIVATGPSLYAAVFGDAWRDAGAFAQWIVVWWAMRFISLPALMLVPVLGMQRRLLMLEVTTLIPRFLVIPAAAWLSGVEAAVAAYSIIGVMFHFFVVVSAWRAVREHSGAIAVAA